MSQTVETVLAAAAAALAAAGIEEARLQARRLAGAVLGLTPAQLLAHPEHTVALPQLRRLRWLVGRMITGEPLTRIIGRREFWSLEFGLSSDTLDPRPDSEVVVSAVLARVPRRDARLRLLDLGTGSGCLLLALLSELPRARGVGVDISPGAATTARMNAAALGLTRRTHFLVGDWGKALADRFAIIVANPPYISCTALADLPHAVRSFDPRMALDGGRNGLDAYRALAADVPRLLTPGGIFVAEVGIGLAGAVIRLLHASGLAAEAIEPDLAGVARCIVSRKTAPARCDAEERQKMVGMYRRPVYADASGTIDGCAGGETGSPVIARRSPRDRRRGRPSDIAQSSERHHETGKQAIARS